MDKCTEDGCSVMTTGICINGQNVDDCSYHTYVDDDGADATTSNFVDEEEYDENDDFDEIDTEAGLTSVHSGKALTIEEANRIARSSRTRLIILAGMPEAGKTTFLLSLHHLFSTTPKYGGYMFAGSETLVEYEEKSHESKLESELPTPVTIRTASGSSGFMHLKLTSESLDGKFIDLLFTDIPGETFKALKDSKTACEQFTLAKRADHFALFFDTEMLTNIASRAKTKATGLGILRGLVEAGSIGINTQIQVIFSRWDLFKRDKNEKNHQDFIQALKEQIEGIYAEAFDISFFEVSCRPSNSTLPFGYGMDSVFSLWAGPNDARGNLVDEINNEHSDCEREYLKFQYKRS